MSNYGFIGANKGLDYPDFEDALKAQGINWQTRTISDVHSLYELTYQYNGQPRYAYVHTTRYDIDAIGQDVFVFSAPIPDASVMDVLEQL